MNRDPSAFRRTAYSIQKGLFFFLRKPLTAQSFCLHVQKQPRLQILTDSKNVLYHDMHMEKMRSHLVPLESPVKHFIQ